jgi:hypothetical protein
VIANDFNYNVRTIERQRVRYNATNSTNDRPRCGRPQVTTARQNRLMVGQHLRNRFTRATETQQRPISADTVRRRLVASNLRCYRPARGPVLTPRHRQERLQWALQRQNWRNQQWRNVITGPSFTLSPMTPHTMMLGPPQAFLPIMQLSSYRSPRLLHNLVLPSAVEMQ